MVRTDEFRWKLLQRRAAEVKVGRAFEIFRGEGIEPILIKGVAADQFYPADEPRLSIDMDLAVARSDFARAKALSFEVASQGLAIDVHQELRHLDTLAWEDLLLNSRLVAIAGADIRVLRPEDHLRVLCVHWLSDGGRDRDRLRDVFYLVSERKNDFDWDRFSGVVSETRRRWLICAIGLAHQYLGLELNGIPFADECKSLPPWLTQTVEREWASEPFLPLEASLFTPATLPAQIRRRFRPNPIWATVQAEGSFDARTRVFYQMASFFRRLPDSTRRLVEAAAQRRK